MLMPNHEHIASRPSDVRVGKAAGGLNWPVGKVAGGLNWPVGKVAGGLNWPVGKAAGGLNWPVGKVAGGLNWPVGEPGICLRISHKTTVGDLCMNRM